MALIVNIVVLLWNCLCWVLCLANGFVSDTVTSKGSNAAASVLYSRNCQTIILVWFCPCLGSCLINNIGIGGVSSNDSNFQTIFLV